MYHIIDIFSVGSETYLLHLFLSMFLVSKKPSNLRKMLYFFILFFGQIIFSIVLEPFFIFRIVLLAVLDIFYCVMLFKDSIRKSMLFVALFYVLVFSTEMIVFSVAKPMFPEFNILTVASEYNLALTAVMSTVRVIQFFAIIFIKTIKGRPIHKKQWRGLLLMPITTLAFMWIVYPRFWNSGDPAMDQLLTSLAIFLVIQNLIVFAYVAVVQSSTEKYLEMKAAYDRQKQYYTTIAAIQEAIRKMAHDVRHHIVYLDAALEDGDVEEAKAYIRKWDANLDETVSLNVTGNYAIDAMLHAKAAQAKLVGIRIVVKGELPPDLEIEPYDLNIVLGNALENAIEAGKRMDPNSRKEISASFAYNRSRLSFTISNPYNGRLRRNFGGYFLSSKANGGLGVKIMDEVVKKYDGMLVTEGDGSTFTLTAMMNAKIIEEPVK